MNYKDIIESHKDFPIKGVEYLDLNPIYKNPLYRDKLIFDCMDKIVDMIPPTFDYIGVIESRGFLIGSILAHLLDKGLILLRSKPGRLPGDTKKVFHTLEYGESQMEVQTGEGNVLIFDDVLATGGTCQAAADVLTMAGYTPIGALFPVEITFLNPSLTVPYKSIVKY
tara:strand:+ start:69 stop:572 length:504 start_codon:yes stop_codon:yes gene_type:complete